MDSKEKKSIIDRIKKLIYATEEQADNQQEDLSEDNKPIMEEIFSGEEDKNKIADIRRIREEKEAREKQEAAKKLKEELKAEIKEELKAEIIDKSEEKQPRSNENIIESILETVIKETKEEKLKKEQAKNKKEMTKAKAKKAVEVTQSEEKNETGSKEVEDKKDNNENKKQEKEIIEQAKQEDTTKEEDTTVINKETQSNQEDKTQDNSAQETQESSENSTQQPINATKGENDTNQNINYTISLTKKELEKAIKKAEKRQKKLIKQQINEEKKLIKQRKLEETLSSNALKANKGTQPIDNSFKSRFRIFLDFINDKSDEYAPDENLIVLEDIPTYKDDVMEQLQVDNRDKTKTDKPVKSEKTENKTDDRDTSNKAYKVPVMNIPIAKDVKKDASKLIEDKPDNKKSKKQTKSKINEIRSSLLFEKPSAKKLSEEDLQKLVINGQKVPEYVYETDVYKITLASDKIASSIKKEFDFYVKEELKKEKVQKSSTDEQESKVNVKKNDNNKNQSYSNKPYTPEKEDEHRTIKEKLFGSYRNVDEYADFASFKEEKEEVVEDYERSQDTRSVRAEINIIARNLIIKSIITGVIFAFSITLTMLQKYTPELIVNNVPNADIMVSIVNVLLLVLGISICHTAFFNGLKPLIWFKGNEDTAVAVASVAVFAQSIISIFDSQAFFTLERNLYLPIVLFALFLNSLGKAVVQLRIKDNFNFLSSENRKYTAKTLEKTKTAEKMIADTKATKPIIAYQRRTKFLSNFLKLSYTPDPSQTMAARFAPICTALAIVIAIVYGIVYNNPEDATSAMSAVLCVAIPVCSLLAVNLPMKRLCKKAVKLNSMIVGYPAVKEFGDTNAIMVDARELYPRGKVELIAVKIFDNIRADKAFVKVSAVLKMANTSLTYMFEEIITDKNVQLPHVDTVKYEDGMGLLSWVNGERILIGNRELMKKYKINLPSVDYEERNKDRERYKVTYIASSGNVIAMLITNYKTTKSVIDELRHLENAGITLLVSTTDPNITQESISKDFNLFYRSVKILPTDLSNICKEEMSVREEESISYIATRGRAYSLIRAITSCIKIKNNISIAIAIQSVSIILGLILISIIALTAGLSGLGAFELFLYVGFWAVATVIAPLLRKI